MSKLGSLLLLAGFSAPLWGQSPGLSCVVTAVNPVIRAEGISERLGDIVLDCAGGTPDLLVTGNLTVFLNTIVTNRLSQNNFLDAVLTVDNGSGPVAANVQARLGPQSSVTWPDLSFRLSPQGRVALRISNIRALASAGGAPLPNVIALLSFSGASLLSFNNNTFSVGVPAQGLLASTAPLVVPTQAGSRLPETLTFGELLRVGTRFSSSRLTEGFPAAFERRQPMTDSGTRVIIRYAGLPPEARLFVPDVVAGSTALTPTAGGDFGLMPSPGRYAVTPSGSLLLARVSGADVNGVGGLVAFTPPLPGAPAVELGAVSEVSLTGGRGYVVYEVLDSNPNVAESAQFPTFLGIPRTIEARTIITTREIYIAPISNIIAASPSAPIPRFLGVPAPSDCDIRDCSVAIPRLVVDTASISFTAEQGGIVPQRFVAVDNAGGGVLVWNAGVQYRTGSNFIHISPTSGILGGSIRVEALTQGLQPGVYEAVLVVDAGPQAGTRQIPITLTITPRSVPPPAIRAITNAATFRPGNLVAGSLATIFGNNFTGQNLQVTFDGIPARILFANNEQINLQVPAELGNRGTAVVAIRVSGVAGQTATVNLAPAAPGVFDPGILNQDNSVNRPDSPAQAGSVIQIFATGVFASGPDRVQVRLHDHVLDPLFAGPAPGFPGVQQINARVPEDLGPVTADLSVCAGSVCSPSVRVTIRR